MATGVDIGQNDVHPAAPITASAPAAAPVTAPVVGNTTIASSSASSQSQDAMDIATSSAGEDDKTDSDPPVGVEIAASVMKIEDTIKSSVTLEEVDGGETKDENAGEEMNIEDESGHESHSSHLSSEGSGTIISKDEGEGEVEGGGIRLSTAVKDQIELISVKVETEKEKENEEEMKNGMEVEIESSSLSVKDEADVDVDIDPSCDTQSIKEEGIVDLLLVKGEIVDESSKEAGKVEGTPREEEIKLTVSSAVSVTPAPVPEPQRNAPLPPITLPRAPDSLSAIHGLRGFLDVGNDALFSTSEPWVLATASLLAKRKLARN